MFKAHLNNQNYYTNSSNLVKEFETPFYGLGMSQTNQLETLTSAAINQRGGMGLSQFDL